MFICGVACTLVGEAFPLAHCGLKIETIRCVLADVILLVLVWIVPPHCLAHAWRLPPHSIRLASSSDIRSAVCTVALVSVGEIVIGMCMSLETVLVSWHLGLSHVVVVVN